MIPMAALTAGTRHGRADHDLAPHGPSLVRTAAPAAADRSPAAARPDRAMRSWPLLVLAVPAAAEVWTGWVGIAQKTGFGLVSPLPGIWPALHLNTAITLPVGVEAYAAYALRAWLASEHKVSGRTRRFAKWSAIFSFTLGMAGQIAYHLLAQARVQHAPWAITTIVSCLPVLVLGMGTALAHMLRADAVEGRPGEEAVASAPSRHLVDRTIQGADQTPCGETLIRPGPPAGTRTSPDQDHGTAVQTTGPGPQQVDHARLVGRQLAAAGRPVTRRALRSSGVRGSNETLNALARSISAELTGTAVTLAGAGIRPVHSPGS